MGQETGTGMGIGNGTGLCLEFGLDMDGFILVGCVVAWFCFFDIG